MYTNKIKVKLFKRNLNPLFSMKKKRKQERYHSFSFYYACSDKNVLKGNRTENNNQTLSFQIMYVH